MENETTGKRWHSTGEVTDIPNIPLASSLHEFKSDTLAEAYTDLEKLGMLNPVGIATLTDIPYIKDQLMKEKCPMRKVPRLVKGATGYYYLRKLSRSERKEFLKEFKLHHRGHFSTQEWLATTFDDLEDFIACSFSWGGSVKGFEYWSKLADRARWWILPTYLSKEADIAREEYKLPPGEEVENTGFPEWTISPKNRLGPTTSEYLDLDTGVTKYDKAGAVHPPILLDSMSIEDETIQASLDYALKLEGDRKVGKTYKSIQSGTYSEPIKKATSNDGFIWTESEAMNNDSFDSLYHTSHDIDHSPSFGNGGDFGGGGASGSWDSGSSSDSGSSDSSSSWSD